MEICKSAYAIAKKYIGEIEINKVTGISEGLHRLL